ncbi:SAM-dependent methyltransferase [Lichenihabitans psoromatis]|uniref:SAM-dependent methyltransferase n=1 Tax=Lichenihabitans psoromatis TaxID=2528642 RepID=UPI0010383A88|nr:SAM-dependent methyltransferase [Lichenihabitans psoromatis]
MSRRTETIKPDYFDRLYTSEPDPWGFRSSDYERRKYAATLAILERAHYADALEIGCSIGVFTRRLAARCSRLVAIDASQVALDTARSDCADLEHVDIQLGLVPADVPEGPFDLIVMSEVLYYLVADDVRRTAAACRRALAPGGEIVLCHWLGETDYPLTGEAAAETFVTAASSWVISHHTSREPGYRLDRLVAGS